MKNIYPVFFTKTDTTVLVEVPDLEILTEGKDMINAVDIDSGEYRRKIDTKSVRKNVTIPSWLNYEAEQAGINVSKVLQDALMNVLNVQRNF